MAQLLVCTLVLAAAGLALRAQDERPPGLLAELPMISPFGLPFIEVSIDGAGIAAPEPCWLGFDTGATQTFLDRPWLEGLGFKVKDLGESQQPGGSMRFGMVRGVTLNLGRHVWPNRTCGAVALTGLEGAVGRRLWGIMGYDLVRGTVVDLDYSAGRMRLFDPAEFVANPNAESLELTIRRTKPLVTVRLTRRDGAVVEGRFLVDVGSMQGVAMSPHFYERVLEEKQPTLASRGWGFGGNQATGKVMRIPRVEVGPYAFDDVAVHAVVADGVTRKRVHDGLLGGEFLRRFRVAFDYSRSRMLLLPNDALGEPVGESLSGLEFYADGASQREIRVFHVYRGSAADRAGVRRDDVLLAVDGKPATEIGLDGLWILMRTGAGETRRLRFRRGAEPRDVTLELVRLPI